MWELEYEESWALKNWCFWTVVLEKTLESPLNCKEIQPVHPMGDQSWVFIGGTDVEAETPILWPPDEKNWLIGKTLMLGKIEGERRSGWQRMRWLDGITDTMDMGLGGLWELVMDREAWHIVIHEVPKSQTQLSEWTELNWTDGSSSIWETSTLFSTMAIPIYSGDPNDTSGNEPPCQSRRHKRHGFDPWIRKIPWRRKCQPTLVFLPG